MSPPQEAPGPEVPEIQQSRNQEAMRVAQQIMRDRGIGATPTPAPRQEAPDPTESTKALSWFHDQSNKGEILKGVFEQGPAFVQRYQKAVLSAPEHLRADPNFQTFTSGHLETMNQYLAQRAHLRAVGEHGTGYAAGVGAVRGGTAALGIQDIPNWVQGFLGMSHSLPLELVGMDGEIQTDPEAKPVSGAELFDSAAAVMRHMDSAGLGHLVPDSVRGKIRWRGRTEGLTDLARVLGEFALVKKGAGLAASKLPAGATLPRAVLQAHSKEGMLGATLAGGAHQGIASTIEGFRTFPDYVKEQVEKTYLDPNDPTQTIESMEERLNGPWSKLMYVAQKAGSGYWTGAGHMFGLAAFTRMAKGTRGFLTGAKGRQFTKALDATIKKGLNGYKQGVTEKLGNVIGSGFDFAAGVEGNEWFWKLVSGGDAHSELMAATTMDDKVDQVLVNFVGGMLMSAAHMAPWSKRGRDPSSWEKMTEAQKWDAVKSAATRGARPTVDAVRENGRITADQAREIYDLAGKHAGEIVRDAQRIGAEVKLNDFMKGLTPKEQAFLKSRLIHPESERAAERERGVEPKTEPKDPEVEKLEEALRADPEAREQVRLGELAGESRPRTVDELESQAPRVRERMADVRRNIEELRRLPEMREQVEGFDRAMEVLRGEAEPTAEQMSAAVESLKWAESQGQVPARERLQRSQRLRDQEVVDKLEQALGRVADVEDAARREGRPTPERARKAAAKLRGMLEEAIGETKEGKKRKRGARIPNVLRQNADAEISRIMVEAGLETPPEQKAPVLRQPGEGEQRLLEAEPRPERRQLEAKPYVTPPPPGTTAPRREAEGGRRVPPGQVSFTGEAREALRPAAEKLRGAGPREFSYPSPAQRPGRGQTGPKEQQYPPEKQGPPRPPPRPKVEQQYPPEVQGPPERDFSFLAKPRMMGATGTVGKLAPGKAPARGPRSKAEEAALGATRVPRSTQGLKKLGDARYEDAKGNIFRRVRGGWEIEGQEGKHRTLGKARKVAEALERVEPQARVEEPAPEVSEVAVAEKAEPKVEAEPSPKVEAKAPSRKMVLTPEQHVGRRDFGRFTLGEEESSVGPSGEKVRSRDVDFELASTRQIGAFVRTNRSGLWEGIAFDDVRDSQYETRGKGFETAKEAAEALKRELEQPAIEAEIEQMRSKGLLKEDLPLTEESVSAPEAPSVAAKELSKSLGKDVKDALNSGSIAVAERLLDEMPPSAERTILEGRLRAAKKKEPRDGEELTPEYEAEIEAVAASKELPSERAREKTPEMDEPLEVQAAIVGLQGEREMAGSFLSGKSREQSAHLKGVLDEVFREPLEAEPITRASDVLVQPVKAEIGKGKGQGWGLNQDFAPSRKVPGRSRASMSFFAQLKRLGKNSPEFAEELAAVAYGPPVPPNILDLVPLKRNFMMQNGESFLGFPGITARLTGEVTARERGRTMLSLEEMKKIEEMDLRPEEVDQLIDARIMQRSWRWREQFFRDVNQAEGRGLQSSKLRGTPVGDGVEKATTLYAKWARVAEKAGYNVMAPVYRGKSMRDLWMRAIYDGRYASAAPKGEAAKQARLLSETVIEPRRGESGDLSRLMHFEDFRVLWRAMEVDQGLFLDSSRAAEVNWYLRRSRIAKGTLEGLKEGLRTHIGEMDQARAQRIVEAWRTGDWRRLQLEGVRKAPMPRQEAVGERSDLKPGKAPEGLEAPKDWLNVDPTSHEFVRTVEALERRVPRIIQEAAGILRDREGTSATDPAEARAVRERLEEVDDAFWNLAESIASKSPKVKGMEVTEAELLFASLVEKAQRTNLESSHAWLDRALDATRRAQTGSRGEYEAINMVRAATKMILERAYDQGWLLDVKGPSGKAESMEVSPRISQLATLIRSAKGYRWEKSPTDISLSYWGEIPPYWKICTSCHVFWRENVDLAARDAGLDPKDPYVSRVRRVLMMTRDAKHSFAYPLLEEHLDPQRKKFVDSVIQRNLTHARERHGNLITGFIAKSRGEKATMLDEWTTRLVQAKKLAGAKLHTDIGQQPPVEKMTPEQLREHNLRMQATDVLEGRADESSLPGPWQKAVREIRKTYNEGRRLLTRHIFRKVIRAAEEAQKAGEPMPQGLMRRWENVLGKQTDPAKVLALIRRIHELPAGQVEELHGVQIRGWGLPDYSPHIWTSSPTEGDFYNYVEHAGSYRHANETVKGRKGHWDEGVGEYPEWARLQVEQHALRNWGVMTRHKAMQNLLHRLKEADGYDKDVFWVMQNYLGRMVDKVNWERTMDDLEPLVFGDYLKLDLTSRESLQASLQNAPTENHSETHSALGGIDSHFGLKLGGRLDKAVVEKLEGGRWVRVVDAKERQTLLRSNREAWRRDTWRWDRKGSGIAEGDPSKWKLTVSNGTNRLTFWTKEGIERAGIQSRFGGVTNYNNEGGQYEAVKKLVAEGFGYDMDTGKVTGEIAGTKLGRAIEDAAARLNDMLYTTQLGGVMNPKAFGVQMVESIIQGMGSIGYVAVIRQIPKFRGYLRFKWHILKSKDPAVAYEEAKAKYADTPYVKEVLPVLEAGQMKMAHMLQSNEHTNEMMTNWEAFKDRFRRINFASFTLGDVFGKELVYKASMEQSKDLESHRSNVSGREVKVTQDYIPVGDMYSRSREVMSAHDIARQMVDQSHYSLSRYAQPGLLKHPAMGFVGHLGKTATNITLDFLRNVGHGAKYVKGGDPMDLWGGHKAGRYALGLFLAYGTSAFLLNRDMGAYVGAHVSDVGVGPFTLGEYLPALRGLPMDVRMPGWQFPEKMSLPMKAVFGGAGEGVPATAGDAFMRWASGEDGLTDSFGGALKRWWHNWSPTIGYGPWSRSGRYAHAAFTAEQSGLDPQRPYAVRQPWFFGPDQKVRYRNAWDLYFADIFLPGSSYRDSREYHRTAWANELNSPRSRIGQELREYLYSADPEARKAAVQELQRRGYPIQTWRVERQLILNKLPAGIRAGIGAANASRVDKLRFFARRAADWHPAHRRIAWRLIMGKAGTSGPMPAGVTPELVREAQDALRAPWGR